MKKRKPNIVKSLVTQTRNQQAYLNAIECDDRDGISKVMVEMYNTNWNFLSSRDRKIVLKFLIEDDAQFEELAALEV